MKKSQHNYIAKLLSLQINSHVEGNTKFSDRYLHNVEEYLTLKEVLNSISKIYGYLQLTIK